MVRVDFSVDVIFKPTPQGNVRGSAKIEVNRMSKGFEVKIVSFI